MELGSSEPPVPVGAFGSATDPFVVELAVAGPQPLVGLSQGSGHLGSGAAVPLDFVLNRAGELESDWVEHFDRAGARWTLPYLRDLLAGRPVTEERLRAAYRRRHGREAVIRVVEVARPTITAEQLRDERRARPPGTGLRQRRT
ncbi:MAG TPA: hypothetical protein PKA07_01260 [Micropruina sp.]|nr:hypothetical protein [Micropruina sp.]